MRFTRDAFLALTPPAREERARELASHLSGRLRDADEFHAEIRRVIESLRQEDHDIWRWDFDDDRQIWGPDYMKWPPPGGLWLQFDAPDVVEAHWIEGEVV